MISTYMISLDVLLSKFVADTVINCFCPHATHLPILISSHTVLSIWNVLPHDTDFSSLAGFKRSLSTNVLQKSLKVYFN